MLEPNFARNQVLKMNFMFNLLFQHFNGFVQEVHEVALLSKSIKMLEKQI